MAAKTYIVAYGCRINGTQYNRLELATLDDADPAVIDAVNRERIRDYDDVVTGITAGDIADGAVTEDKLAANSVVTGKIANGTIVNDDNSGSAAIAASKIAGTAVVTNDSRLSDARTPVAGYPWGFAYVMDPRVATGTGNVNANNNCWFMRISAGATISKIGMQVANQSGNISVAAYSNTGSGRSAVPGTQLATSGAVSCPATGYAEVSLGQTVTVAAGDWLAISADNTTATFAVFAGFASNFSAGISGLQASAHPAPANPSMTVSGQRAYVLIGVP